jgi:transcriptional regulator with XRE-family HTH domain
MNQPQLGLKVSELRQQKGLTQGQLAERCEVSPLTFQVIESGEVDRRALRDCRCPIILWNGIDLPYSIRALLSRSSIKAWNNNGRVGTMLLHQQMEILPGVIARP